eukprot:SAG11_NODE_849_length_6877_cov_15.646946_7_plen_150_part_00
MCNTDYQNNCHNDYKYNLLLSFNVGDLYMHAAYAPRNCTYSVAQRSDGQIDGRSQEVPPTCWSERRWPEPAGQQDCITARALVSKRFGWHCCCWAAVNVVALRSTRASSRSSACMPIWRCMFAWNTVAILGGGDSLEVIVLDPTRDSAV